MHRSLRALSACSLVAFVSSCTGGEDTSTASASAASSSSSAAAASSSSSAAAAASSGGAASSAAAASSSSTGGAAASSSAAAASSAASSSAVAASSSSAAAAASSSSGGGAVTWSGAISGDVADNSTVTMTGSIVSVAAGTTVVVGNCVTINGTGKIQVSGTLSVLGTAACPVTISGVGFEVLSGGNLTVSNANMDAPSTGLLVQSNPGAVTFYKVNVNNAGTSFDIRGGRTNCGNGTGTTCSPLIDGCTFNGGGSSISGAGTHLEIRNSVMTTGGPGDPDFLVFNNGASAHVHHNEFPGAHCSIHANGLSTTRTTLFEYNIFNGASYAIMQYAGGVTVEMHNNEIRSGSGDVFDGRPNSSALADATGNYWTARACPANGAGVTHQPCASGPIAGVGPQP